MPVHKRGYFPKIKAHEFFKAQHRLLCEHLKNSRNADIGEIDRLWMGTNYYAVAEDRGVAVGFYSLSDLSQSDVELGLLFVEPKHIGAGVGRILIEHAKNHAIACGGRTLHIQGDPNAEDFYKAVGATLTGKRESSSIPGRFLPTFSISLASEGVA